MGHCHPDQRVAPVLRGEAQGLILWQLARKSHRPLSPSKQRSSATLGAQSSSGRHAGTRRLYRLACLHPLFSGAHFPVVINTAGEPRGLGFVDILVFLRAKLHSLLHHEDVYADARRAAKPVRGCTCIRSAAWSGSRCFSCSREKLPILRTSNQAYHFSQDGSKPQYL